MTIALLFIILLLAFIFDILKSKPKSQTKKPKSKKQDEILTNKHILDFSELLEDEEEGE